MDLAVSALLTRLGLDRFLDKFRENEVDARSLPMLTSGDLTEMGIPIGPRRLILEALAAETHGPGALTPAEAAALAEDRLAGAPEAVRADLPAWLAPAFAEAFADPVGEAQALAARAPVDLRVNTLKAEREKVLGQLARHGAEATPISPVGVRLPPRAGWERAPTITREDLYLRGHVEVQDEASQVAALLVGAEPGEQVLDLCAGAGGKTLALAAAMDNRGQLHATDADAGQLAPIYDRLKRAGTRNAQGQVRWQVQQMAAPSGKTKKKQRPGYMAWHGIA